MARAAVEHTCARVRQIQPLFGARNAHIGKPTLLLHFTGRVERLDAGENSPLHPRDEYHRGIPTFGGVQRHEDNGIRLLIIIINIRHQSDLFEEAIEIALFVILTVAQKVGGKLLDILQPVLIGFTIQRKGVEVAVSRIAFSNSSLSGNSSAASASPSMTLGECPQTRRSRTNCSYSSAWEITS